MEAISALGSSLEDLALVELAQIHCPQRRHCRQWLKSFCLILYAEASFSEIKIRGVTTLQVKPYFAEARKEKVSVEHRFNSIVTEKRRGS